MTQQHSGVNHFLPDPDNSADVVGSTPVAGSFGSSLRSLRESRGWGVADVSARLKFGVRQIEALESDRWEDLPQGPSLRGLIRNYARLLDVAPDALMSALPEHLQHQSAPVGNLTPVGALPHGTLPRWSGDGRRRRSWPMVVMVLFLLSTLALAAYLVFAWWLPRNADTGPSEIAGFPMVDGRESSLAINPLRPEQPTATVDTSQVAPDDGVNPAAGSSAASGAGSPNVSMPGVTSGAAGSRNTGVAGAGTAATLPHAGQVPGVSTPGVSTPGAPAAGVAGPTAAGSIGQAASTGAATPAGGLPEAGVALSAPADPAAPAPLVVGNQLQFNVTAASWVEVRDASGAVVLSSTLQPGSNPQVEANPPVRVVIGNAKGVSLEWQGSVVDLGPHQRGNVARLTLE